MPDKTNLLNPTRIPKGAFRLMSPEMWVQMGGPRAFVALITIGSAWVALQVKLRQSWKCRTYTSSHRLDTARAGSPSH